MILSIISFLFISFAYSLFEKLKDKKGYTIFLTNHLGKEKLSSFLWWFLVVINSITTLVLFLGITSILFNFCLFPLVISFKTTTICILFLLFGQRIAGDFQGAANLGIYMILNILGWYLHLQ